MTITYQDIIQDGSWDGPEKVHCPTITSVGWLVDHSDPVKIAGTLDDERKPCAILAIPRGCVLAINEVSIEHPKNPENIS